MSNECSRCDRLIIDTLVAGLPDTQLHSVLFDEIRRRSDDVPGVSLPSECQRKDDCARLQLVARTATEVVLQLPAFSGEAE